VPSHGNIPLTLNIQFLNTGLWELRASVSRRDLAPNHNFGDPCCRQLRTHQNANGTMLPGLRSGVMQADRAEKSCPKQYVVRAAQPDRAQSMASTLMDGDKTISRHEFISRSRSQSLVSLQKIRNTVLLLLLLVCPRRLPSHDFVSLVLPLFRSNLPSPLAKLAIQALLFTSSLAALSIP